MKPIYMALAGLAFIVACGESPTTEEPGPRLLSVSPVDGATAVDPAAAVRLTFSEPMLQGAEESVELTEASTGTQVELTASWSDDGRGLELRPVAALKAGTEYRLHIGAMHDREHRPLHQDEGSMMGGMRGMGDHGTHHGGDDMHSGDMDGMHSDSMHAMHDDPVTREQCEAMHDAMSVAFTTR